MQGAKHSDAPWHREHLQRRSAPAGGEPNVQVVPERALSVAGRSEVQRLVIRRVARPSNERVGTNGSGIFCGMKKELRFTEELGKQILRDLVTVTRRELGAAGYPRVNESAFGKAAEGDVPEYQIGATLTDVEIRVCGKRPLVPAMGALAQSMMAMLRCQFGWPGTPSRKTLLPSNPC